MDEQTTTGKRGRKPSKPNIKQVVEAISRGDYDGYDLIEISKAISAREEIVKEQVLAQVRAVYGRDAKIVTGMNEDPLVSLFKRTDQGSDIEASEGATEQNPFIKLGKANEEAGSEAAKPEDPLAHLDEIEKKMEPPLDIERRGASISGLHPSDISD